MRKKIVLIPCVSEKKEGIHEAEHLYVSSLFRLCLAYAKGLNPDEIYILSAKYGLLELNRKIETYNETLNTMKKEQRTAWARSVIADLEKKADLQNDEFVILAGAKYRENLIKHIRNYSLPLEGLRIGEQMSWLKGHTL